MPEICFDVLIAGAGPAGAATAMSLSGRGLSVGVLDKAVFPRDKICGDALSVDVVNQLTQLSPALARSFQELDRKTAAYGVRIFSPDSHHVDIPFVHRGKEKCGYTCTRSDFDNLLVLHLKSLVDVTVIEDCPVESVVVDERGVKVHTPQGTFAAKIIVAADGAQSVVGKQLHFEKMDRRHYSAGLRVYYENVRGFHNANYIELYFFKDTLPGYLWVFPLTGNKANVGIGMLSSEVSRKKVNLSNTLTQLLTTHPVLKLRFRNARPLETIKGFGLPLGSKRRWLSGDRYLLAGDAASLIDPFTGEGIANAIRSGRIAAEHIGACFAIDDFSAAFNKAYDRELYSRMSKEFAISKMLQRLCQYPWLFDTVVKKANQSKYIHQVLIDALAQVDKKRSLFHPAFYFRLFLK